jgi:LPXTG-site transpeptidase (sortase) family protein
MDVTVTSQTNKPWWWRNRFRLTAAITATSFLLCLLAYSIGLIPSGFVYKPATARTTATDGQTASSQTNLSELETTQNAPTDELPVRIRIPAVSIDTKIQNPASKRTDVLNRYLAESAVRYPESGKPGDGNMFVFGHSSGLDSVINQAYKTFNRLENLSAGDTIYISTESGTFTYTVQTVNKRENTAAYVPFGTNKDLLTIATCDNFGAKEDRIIVRAEYSGYAARP